MQRPIGSCAGVLATLLVSGASVAGSPPTPADERPPESRGGLLYFATPHARSDEVEWKGAGAAHLCKTGFRVPHWCAWLAVDIVAPRFVT